MLLQPIISDEDTVGPDGFDLGTLVVSDCIAISSESEPNDSPKCHKGQCDAHHELIG